MAINNLLPYQVSAPVVPEYENQKAGLSGALHNANQTRLAEEQLKETKKQSRFNNTLEGIKAAMQGIAMYDKIKTNEVARETQQLDDTKKGIELQAKLLDLRNKQEEADGQKKFLDDLGAFQQNGQWEQAVAYLMSNLRQAQANPELSTAILNQAGKKLNLDRESTTDLLNRILPTTGESFHRFDTKEENLNTRASFKGSNTDLAARQRAFKEQQTQLDKFNSDFYTDTDISSALSPILNKNMLNPDNTANLTDLFNPSLYSIKTMDLDALEKVTDRMRLIQGMPLAEGVSGSEYGGYVDKLGAPVNPNTGEPLTTEETLMWDAQQQVESRSQTGGLKVSGLNTKTTPASKVLFITNNKTGLQASLVLDKNQVATYIKARNAATARLSTLEDANTKAGLAPTPNPNPTPTPTPVEAVVDNGDGTYTKTSTEANLADNINSLVQKEGGVDEALNLLQEKETNTPRYVAQSIYKWLLDKKGVSSKDTAYKLALSFVKANPSTTNKNLAKRLLQGADLDSVFDYVKATGELKLKTNKIIY